MRAGSAAAGCRPDAAGSRSGCGTDKEARGSPLSDRLLVAVHPDGELPGGRLRLAQLELGVGNESLVVEPVQEVTVVLGEPDDGCPRSGRQLGERGKIAVLGLLDVRVHGPAVGAAVGI